jgi:uracil-DNA glycosylase
MQIVSELLPLYVHASWHTFLTDEIKYILDKISRQISESIDITPSNDLMLRFMQLNLNDVKVLILGQDPYPQSGVATGRAFEVGTLNSWQQPFRNTSLRNIVRALYALETGNILTYNEIKAKMLSSEAFSIMPPNEIFSNWEKQGVLLLNTSFSCRIGEPGSHSAIWQPFTRRLMEFINRNAPGIIWMLWGNHARDAIGHIRPVNTLYSCHPMICHQRQDDFLYGTVNPFAATAHLIRWTGKEFEYNLNFLE